MSRSLYSSLLNLKTVCEAITTITPKDGSPVTNPFSFLAYPDIPGGTIDETSWGITFPLGLWTAFRNGQESRESGTVGSPSGQDNQYLLRLLISSYQGISGRLAGFAEEEAFFSAFKDVVVPADGNQCFPGVVWARITREQPDFLVYAGVQYLGSYVIVTLQERYD